MVDDDNTDISQQELIEEYGMTEENATKLLRDLPNIVQEFLKEQRGPEQTGQPQPQPQAYPSPYPQFTGNEDEDVDVLDELIFLTEQDMVALKDITDEEILEALDYLDQLIDPLFAPIGQFARTLGGVQPAFGGPVVGPALRAIEGRPRTLIGLLIEELFGLPTTPAEVPEQEAPRAPVRRTPARPKRAEREPRRTFLSRLRAQSNALDKRQAGDSASCFHDIYPFADEIVMTLDSENFTIEDGVLKTNAVATANMVQEYDDKKILKDADELKKAVQYARQLPICDGHPPDKIVTSQDEIKGFTGPVTYDESNKNIKCSVEISDADLIEKVKAGKTDVSIGFMCDLDNTPGEFEGMKYDAIQRNIILNHLACGIDSGRCPGGTCGLGMDDKTNIGSDDVTDKDKPKPTGDAGGDETPAEKARKKFNISKEEWDKLSKEEQDKWIAKLEEGDEEDFPPKTEAERAMAHFNITKEEWEAMTKEEQEAKIKELPPRGTATGPEDDPEPAEDLDVAGHEKLLKEKTDAIAALAKEIADKATTMTPQEIQAKVSDIERIGWDLRDATAVIQAKKLGVDEKLLDLAKDSFDIGKKLQADNQCMFDEHASLVDEVMDHSPPRERDFYEKKSIDELKELVLLLDTTAPLDSSSGSDDGHAKSVSDAFKNATDKRLGKDKKN